MNKVVLLCIWLAAGMALILGVIVLHLRSGIPLQLRVRGLGIEISVDSGSIVNDKRINQEDISNENSDVA